MDTQIEHWIKLTLPYDENISEALQQQHHASQIIALVGRHLIPKEADDSNTNMDYWIGKGALVGNPFASGLQIGLELAGLNLFIQNENSDHLKDIPLEGKTKKETLSILKNDLVDLKVDVINLKHELHYELPDHSVEHGAPFGIKDKQFLQESTYYRHNAEIILESLISELKDVAPPKIWPHHFDTGTFIPLAYNGKGDVSKSIGLGWAIPDTMMDEPYYYISHWSEDKSLDFNKLPALESGEWILSGWQGGVLKMSEILRMISAEEQFDHVKAFFVSGIEVLS